MYSRDCFARTVFRIIYTSFGMRAKSGEIARDGKSRELAEKIRSTSSCRPPCIGDRRYVLVCEPKWHGRAYGPVTVFIVIVIAACRNPRVSSAHTPDTNQTQSTATFISASLLCECDGEFNLKSPPLVSFIGRRRRAIIVSRGRLLIRPIYRGVSA